MDAMPPQVSCSGERDLIVDDVQVVGMEGKALDLLAVRGDERHNQDVDVGHVRFDDLLRLHGQGLPLGGVGLPAVRAGALSSWRLSRWPSLPRTPSAPAFQPASSSPCFARVASVACMSTFWTP